MADLQTTATETVAKLTALLEDADQTHTGLTQVRDQLTQVSEQIETSWSALSERAQALLDRTTSAREELTTEAGAVSEGLTQFRSTLETQQEEASQEQEETTSEVTALGGELETHGSDFEATLQEIHDSLQSLKQRVEEAEAELEHDVRKTLRKIYFAASGDAGPREDERTPNPFGMVARDGGLLDDLPDPTELPPWLKPSDFDEFVESFERCGFRGGLNYYRNLDRNWALQGAFEGAAITHGPPLKRACAVADLPGLLGPG